MNLRSALAAVALVCAGCAVSPPDAMCRAGDVDIDQIAPPCQVSAQPEPPTPGALEFRILPSGVRVRSGSGSQDPRRFLATGLSVHSGGTGTLTVEIRNVSALPVVASFAYTPGVHPIAYVDEPSECESEAEINGELAFTGANHVVAVTLAPGGVIRQNVEVSGSTPGCELAEHKKVAPRALTPGSHAFRVILPILDQGTPETGVRWQEFHLRVDITA